MARILKLLTVNVAVESHDVTVPRYEALGLTQLPPWILVDPPSQIADISVVFPEGGAISLISPTDDTSPVRRFLDKRGEGPYSLCILVDNLVELMAEWKAGGVEWVLDEPLVDENSTAVQYSVERLLMNWVKPKSLHGVMLEVLEFQGEVKSGVDADGKPIEQATA